MATPPRPEPDGQRSAPSTRDPLVERLTRRSQVASRYEVGEEIGRGGMGRVLRVRDADLDRELAMKVVRAQDDPEEDAARRARFLAEARITGRLDHPGIVPVHELGIGLDGAPFFTMKLVRGRDLGAVIRLAREGDAVWTRTRVLEALLRACEAVAFAHARGVIHRDLKPDNIRVGDFGEVYVMDWGLARELDGPGARDLRLAPREAGADDADGSPLRTVEGLVLGTPAFMPPEQALGRVDQVDARADVYALGAILHVILTGQPPYVRPGERIGGWGLIERVRAGGLAPTAESAPDAPAELCSICDRAMARDASRRYADVGELATDLRAFLEARVVRAHRTGALAELRSWVRRNRRFAWASGAAIATLVAGLAVSSWLWSRAETRQRQVFQLSVSRELDTLEERAEGLWPLRPDLVPAAEAWVADARALLEGSGARPGLADLQATRDAVAARLAGGTADDRWWHEQLDRLVQRLHALTDASTGLVSGIHPVRGPGVELRIARARELETRTVEDPEVRRRWDEARASIADEAQCPGYRGLHLAPQRGLVPLSRNPASGLWEFAHAASGPDPRPISAGGYVTGIAHAIVLVLVPGGRTRIGAQRSDPAAPHYDPSASNDEAPVDDVDLEPFFLGKHEVTREQWLLLSGQKPSARPNKPERVGLPVDQVSWEDAVLWLGRHDLTLPTEAQWEHAARAGTVTPWWTGTDPASLEGAANLADLKYVRVQGHTAEQHMPWDDGFAEASRVGELRPNGFGLHDVCGNLQEWCLEAHVAAGGTRRGGSGERVDSARPDNGQRVLRGGSYDAHAEVYARSAARSAGSRTARFANAGIRAARQIDP